MSQSIFAHVCHLAVKLKTLFCRYEFAQNYYFFPQNIIFLETGTENNPFQIHAVFTIHSKKCWVVLTQFWVKYGQTPKCWVKNVM